MFRILQLDETEKDIFEAALTAAVKAGWKIHSFDVTHCQLDAYETAVEYVALLTAQSSTVASCDFPPDGIIPELRAAKAKADQLRREEEIERVNKEMARRIGSPLSDDCPF